MFWGFGASGEHQSHFTRVRSPGREKSAFPWQFSCLSSRELSQLCQTQSPAMLQAHHQQITFMVPSLQHLPFTEPQTPEDPSLAHRSQPFLLPCLLDAPWTSNAFAFLHPRWATSPVLQCQSAGGLLVVKHLSLGPKIFLGGQRWDRGEVGQRHRGLLHQQLTAWSAHHATSDLAGVLQSPYSDELLCHWMASLNQIPPLLPLSSLVFLAFALSQQKYLCLEVNLLNYCPSHCTNPWILNP